MVKTLLSASLVAIASLLAAIPAHALSLNWQFTDQFGSNGVIKGTIDGLAIGDNSGTGLTATVTDTPTGQLLGNYFFESGDIPAFTVDAGGNVTFAAANFTTTGSPVGNVLNFNIGVGPGGGGAQLLNPDTFDPNWFGTPTFSTPVAVPFDFSPTPAVLILGGIFAAKKLRNKLVKK